MGVYVRVPHSVGPVNESQLRSELDRLDFYYDWLGSRSRVVEIFDPRSSLTVGHNQASHADVFLVATVQWADENGTEETQIYASVAFCRNGHCFVAPAGMRCSGQETECWRNLASWREGVLKLVQALQFYLSQIGDATPVCVTA